MYLGYDFKRKSVREVGYTYEVVSSDCIIYMSCLRSGLFEKGAIGRAKVMLNPLVFVPSVVDIIFGVVFVTVNEPSHFA